MRVRMKLSDFIDTEYEDEIMELINNVHKDLQSFILLHLWYNEGDNIKLKDFLMRWEDKLSFKTIVKQGSSIRMSDFIWFDIVPSGTSYNSRKRFQFGYTKKEHILRGLDDFYNVAKFTTSEKPVKKQKRNDYED